MAKASALKVELEVLSTTKIAAQVYEEGCTNISGYYAEIGLDMDGKEVIGYDGVMILPQALVDHLRSKGYVVED